MKFCNSHLTRNIFNLYMRCFFFGLVYSQLFNLKGGCRTLTDPKVTLSTLRSVELKYHLFSSVQKRSSASDQTGKPTRSYRLPCQPP